MPAVKTSPSPVTRGGSLSVLTDWPDSGQSLINGPAGHQHWEWCGPCFLPSSSLTSVMIPESVTNIGDYAFEDLRTLSPPFFSRATPPPLIRRCSSRTPMRLFITCRGPRAGGATFAGLRPVQTYYTYPGSAPGTIGYQGYLCGAATIPPTKATACQSPASGRNAFNNSPFSDQRHDS